MRCDIYFKLNSKNEHYACIIDNYNKSMGYEFTIIFNCDSNTEYGGCTRY